MNFSLKQEIGLASLLLFIIIAIHYFISVASDKYWKGLCDSWYCLELIPLGDVISISVAIIGLYFVVKSLDAWKHQDQYQTAKENLRILNKLIRNIDYIHHLLVNEGTTFIKYKEYIDKKHLELNIENDINKIYENIEISKSLHHEKIKCSLDHLYRWQNKFDYHMQISKDLNDLNLAYKVLRNHLEHAKKIVYNINL